MHCVYFIVEVSMIVLAILWCSLAFLDEIQLSLAFFVVSQEYHIIMYKTTYCWCWPYNVQVFHSISCKRRFLFSMAFSMCRVICVIIVIILPSWLALKRNVLHGGTHITRFLVLLLLIFALCLFVLPAWKRVSSFWISCYFNGFLY